MLADYADLDTRHLGSVYEGLLEHEFRIADEQLRGSLGRRRAGLEARRRGHGRRRRRDG
ncbi:MAG: hypothetical protein U5K28_01635 [Halobacteriales archaeon]|nr:hypothetical protein [Halobacteriales archaeon]